MYVPKTHVQTQIGREPSFLLYGMEANLIWPCMVWKHTLFGLVWYGSTPYLALYGMEAHIIWPCMVWKQTLFGLVWHGSTPYLALYGMEAHLIWPYMVWLRVFTMAFFPTGLVNVYLGMGSI